MRYDATYTLACSDEVGPYEIAGGGAAVDRAVCMKAFLDDYYNADVLGGTRVSEHALQMEWNIARLKTRHAVIGHSFGGLIAQMLAGEGVAAVTIAISPAPFRGVLPLPFSALKSASPVLGNPTTMWRSRSSSSNRPIASSRGTSSAGDSLLPSSSWGVVA